MASELQLYLDPNKDTGLGVVARVFSAGVQVGADIPAAEVGTTAVYVGDFPALAAGNYAVRFHDSTTNTSYGAGEIDWDGTQEITEHTLDLDIADLDADVAALEVLTQGEHDATQADIAALAIDIGGVETLIQAEHATTQADIAALQTLTQTEHDATQADIAAIPMVDLAPLTADVAALQSSADADHDATQAAIAAIPATDLTPVLTGITDLDSDIAALNDISLAEIEGSTVLAKTSDILALNDISAEDVWNATTRTLTAFPDLTLDPSEYLAIATAVEQAILDEGDGQQVLNAIVGAIGNMNVDEIALVAAIRADIERAGGAIDSLNDFDPAVDVVANVALVDTTTTNTDMRGTDGANTVAPDNAGIASNSTDIAANSTAIAALAAALTAVGTDVTDILADTNELQSDDIPSLIAALPNSANITALQDVLDLLRRYHDNRTAYFAADGTTEVPQMDAFFVVVYEDDNVTELKRIALQNEFSIPTVLPESTRYERI